MRESPHRTIHSATGPRGEGYPGDEMASGGRLLPAERPSRYGMRGLSIAHIRRQPFGRNGLKAITATSSWGNFPCLVLALLVLSLLVPGNLSCSDAGGEAPRPPEEQVIPQEESLSEDIPGLSVEQARMVNRYGYPDHFFISLDPATGDRMERWTYFSLGKAYDFYNGRLDGEESVEDESRSYPPTSLRPQDFSTSTTAQELEATLGKPLLRHELKNSLQAPNLMLVYPHAVFLFRDGKLMGMDTKVNPPSLLEEPGSR